MSGTDSWETTITAADDAFLDELFSAVERLEAGDTANGTDELALQFGLESDLVHGWLAVRGALGAVNDDVRLPYPPPPRWGASCLPLWRARWRSAHPPPSR